MRRYWTISLFLALAAACASAPQAKAASLQVAPVRINVPPQAAASRITLSNLGEAQIQTQIRIFRWVQDNGKDRLVETRDVAVSPPILRLEPGAQNVVRIVRTAKTPVAAEESYRVIVDQLPPRANASSNNVSFLFRYSIPVFFQSAQDTRAGLAWALGASKGRPVLTVTNTGKASARLSNLSLALANGKAVSTSPGLLGYVLPNSTVRFELAGSLKGVKPGQTLLIKAEGSHGAIQAKAELGAAK